jgi:hypothetical protein
MAHSPQRTRHSGLYGKDITPEHPSEQAFCTFFDQVERIEIITNALTNCSPFLLGFHVRRSSSR